MNKLWKIDETACCAGFGRIIRPGNTRNSYTLRFLYRGRFFTGPDGPGLFRPLNYCASRAPELERGVKLKRRACETLINRKIWIIVPFRG